MNRSYIPTGFHSGGLGSLFQDTSGTAAQLPIRRSNRSPAELLPTSADRTNIFILSFVYRLNCAEARPASEQAGVSYIGDSLIYMMLLGNKGSSR